MLTYLYCLACLVGGFCTSVVISELRKGHAVDVITASLAFGPPLISIVWMGFSAAAVVEGRSHGWWHLFRRPFFGMSFYLFTTALLLI